MSLRATLVHNTTYNAAGRFWDAGVNLVLTAYIVHWVGVAGWGLWALVGAFAGYISLFDLGMGSGFARYVAEFAAKKEQHRISAVVSTGLFVYLLLGGALLASVIPLIGPLVHLIMWMGMNDPHEVTFLSDTRFLLTGAVILFVCANCIAPFTAVQIGLQRMGVTNVISFLGSWIKIAATVLFLEWGFGLRGLLYAQAMVLLFFAMANVATAYWMVPRLSISPRCLSREVFGLLFGYGWKTQVVRLCNIVAFQTDKLIVGGIYRQLDLVGAYRIGEEIASKMRQIPVLLLSAMIPAAADLDARGDEERLQILYLRSTKYVAAITIPLVAFVAGASGSIIRTWMGDENLYTAVWVSRIIAIGYLANILPGAGISIVLGKGRPEIQMMAGIIEMSMNILLTIALALSIGFYGVPLGTALAMVISCVYVVRVMHRVVDVSAIKIFRVALVWPTVAVIPGLVACIAADWITTGSAGRMFNGAAVLISGAFLALSYFPVLWRSPFLDNFDREFIKSVVPSLGGLKRISHPLPLGEATLSSGEGRGREP